ncbi:MAG: hypothetical protein IKN64_11015 [Desulfovibrio sp.]|nr:hypothetical protein [Desulfovibrio sp.]
MDDDFFKKFEFFLNPDDPKFLTMAEAWFNIANLFNEQLSPRNHAALLLSAPTPAQMTSLHYFLRGQFSLRLIMAMQNGATMDSLIPKQYHSKLLAFIRHIRSQEQFFKEIRQAARRLSRDSVQRDIIVDSAKPSKREKAFRRLLKKYDPLTRI